MKKLFLILGFSVIAILSYAQPGPILPGHTGLQIMNAVNNRFAAHMDSIGAHHVRIASNTAAHTLNYNGILSLIDSVADHRAEIDALTEAVEGLEVGGGMTYPGAGIPLSTGSAWGTSITDNSATWNAAEPGLGNPGVNGYILSSTTGGTRSWVEMTGGTEKPLSSGR